MFKVFGVHMRYPATVTAQEAFEKILDWLKDEHLEATMWDWQGSIGVEFSQAVDRDRIQYSAPWMPVVWGEPFRATSFRS